MFEVLFEKEMVEDAGEVICYGIKSPGGHMIHNLCVNFEETKDFVQLLNKSENSEAHLMDFVEDFLLRRFH